MASDQAEEEEKAHFQDVVGSFLDYQPYMMQEVARRERHYRRMPPAHQALLPNMMSKVDRLKAAVQANQAFLRQAVEEHLPLPARPNAPLSAERHMSKLKSTLHQLVRDWSVEGQAKAESDS